MSDTSRVADAEPKDVINRRVQHRYDELRAEGKHGHYETLFRIVHEERGAALREARAKIERLRAVAEAAQRVNDEYEEDVPMRSMPPLRKALAALGASREGGG